MASIVICTLYRFTPIAEPQRWRARLLAVMRRSGVLGTLVLAGEGINGTVAGGRSGVDAVLAWLRRQPGLGGLEARESFADAPPFKRARVKIRREIVTLGVDGVEVARAGGHVEAEDCVRALSLPCLPLDSSLLQDEESCMEWHTGGLVVGRGREHSPLPRLRPAGP